MEVINKHMGSVGREGICILKFSTKKILERGFEGDIIQYIPRKMNVSGDDGFCMASGR